MLLRSSLLCWCLFTALWAVQADDPKAGLKASLTRIQVLRADRPADGLLIYYESLLQAALGEKEQALSGLRSLLGRKLGLVPSPGRGWDALWQDAEFQALHAQLEAEEPKTPPAPVAFRLKDPKLIPEGLAYDPRSRRFFVGSVAQHKIVAVDRRGRVRDLSTSADGLDLVLGMVVDAPRRRLYAVSTNGFGSNMAGELRNAVVRYDLATGKLSARYSVPDAKQLNDVALGPDGSLYVTDSAAGSLYRMGPRESGFTRLGEDGALRGANGVAVAPDGTVYVTLSTGVARVDPGSGKVERMPQPDTVVTGGIDGLYWFEGSLLGVQNAANPGRVVRIALSEDGYRISGLAVLQSHHHPAFDEPTTGVLVGRTFHVIANSHLGRYQPDRSLADPATLKPTVLLAVPVQP